MVPRTGDKQLLRDLNRTVVLNLIAQRGPISRTDLARQGNLPAATITRIVNEFTAAGLVSEGKAAESSGGRPPILLHINAGAGYVVGVKLREDGMTVALCDLACTVLYHLEAPLSSGLEPYQAVEAISNAVERCIAAAGIPRDSVFGTGVGFSGLIDSARGLCRYSAILGWSNVELGPALEFKLRMQVHVDNDVNTLAIAERQFGAGRDVADFLLVTVGRGIGLGIVVGGEIYRGEHGGAGEFGHLTVDISADAPLCNCGKSGCLEAVASDYGIVRAATGADPGHHIEQEMTALLARARTGDALVQRIFARAGTALGVALANLVNIFDPALLLIGGEGLRAADLLLDAVRSTIPRHVFGISGNGEGSDLTPLLLLTTTDVEWARGAASLVLREVFRPPIYDTGLPLPIDELLARRRPRRASDPVRSVSSRR